MAITAEEAAAEVEATRTDAEQIRAAGVKIRNRLGEINQTVEANVEGASPLSAADVEWYKAWLDRCPSA
tara:strand:- start:113 stop:319 length:207 start_codon:yes stop_codon:yes gene_type:complete